MAIFTKQAVVESFPAYDIVEREANYTGFVNITSDDTLGLKCTMRHRNESFYRTYTPGSVASYALKNNRDPIEAIEDTKRKMVERPYDGHKLHWINANGACISSSPRPRELLVNVTLGMRVCFEGLHFTIERDFNNNLKFVPYVKAD